MRADILDKARQFSIVTPHYHGAAYFQDGRYFTVDGNRVMLPGEAPKTVASAPSPAPIPQPPPAAAPVPTLMAANNEPAVLDRCPDCGRPYIPGPIASTRVVAEDLKPLPQPAANQHVRLKPPVEEPADERVNLTAWGKGYAQYRWPLIRAAFRDELGIAQIKNKQDALEKLLERDIISREDYEREAKVKLDS